VTDWRDSLRRVRLSDGREVVGGSFRGVPFLVSSDDRSGGRRAPGHEFWGRDNPYYEDGGRKARHFRVEAYVLGDDFAAQRDALLAALEDVAGPGELVHPYYGRRTVVCLSVSVRHAVADGRMASFAIEFAEAPAQGIAPSEDVDISGLVDAAATSAADASAKALASGYDILHLPAFALEKCQAALRAATDGVQLFLAPVSETAEELASLSSQMQTMTSQASALIGAPVDAVDALRTAITEMRATIEAAPGAVKDALLKAYAYVRDAVDPPEETTPTRQREAANVRALQGVLCQSLVIEAARIAPSVPYASIDEASASRDAVTDAIDELLQTAADPVYDVLAELRATVARALPSDTTTARMVTLEQRVAVPSLLLAYRLYGAVDAEGDIIARNGVRRPAFVSGALRVLTDV